MTRIRPASRRSGFSLLELVISSAVLVGIFALLTLAMTRIHGVRLDADRQTRLLTEGRAILDRIEDDLRNAAGTNFFFFEGIQDFQKDYHGLADARSRGAALSSMAFIRHAALPRGIRAGEAATNAPFLTVLYDFTATNETAVWHREASPWRTPEEATTNAHYATEYTFTYEDGESFTVTNAVPSFDDTYVNPASAGDTVTLPVTSGSTRRLAFQDAYVLDGWVDVVPTESALTNLLRRPPAVSWPAPQTNMAALAQTLLFDSASFTNSAPLADAFLGYTNVPFASVLDARLAIDVFSVTNPVSYVASTNGLDYVVSTNGAGVASTHSVGSVVSTNDLGVVSTNAVAFMVSTNDFGVLSTNSVPLVVSTNDLGVVSTNVVLAVATTNLLAATTISVTNVLSLATTLDLPPPLSPVLTNEFGEVTNAVWDAGTPHPVVAFSTNAPPLDGAAALVAYPPATPVPGYWTYYASSTVTNAPVPATPASSGGAVTNGPIHIDLSGTIAAVTNAPGTIVATNSLDGLAVFYQTSDLFRLQTSPDAPPSLTNLHWLADAIAFTNRFAPILLDGSPMPLDLLQIVTVREGDFLDASYVSVDTSMAAHGVDCGISPVRSARIDRAVTCMVEQTVTPSNLLCVVTLDVSVSSAYALATTIPSSLVATNRYHYADWVARNGPRTASSTDTEWREFTLDEDYPGGIENIVGIWLEEQRREGREVRVSERRLYRPVAVAGPEVHGTPSSDRDYGSVYWAAFTPFCFRKDGKTGVIDLAVWDPEDEEAEPPVCVDVYLELLSPAHRRRAETLEGEAREAFIQAHVLRLTRRVALSGHNLVGEPR